MKQQIRKKAQLILSGISARLVARAGNFRFKREKEKQEQLILANLLSRIILASSDVARVGTEFVYELKELIDIDWAAIGLIDEAKARLRLFPLSDRLNADWEPGNDIPLDDTPFAWLRQNKKALLEKDLAARSRFWTGTSWLKTGIRTIAYMPLFSEGEVFGGLVFASNKPRAYGYRELRLLKYATGQITATIRHSGLFSDIVDSSSQANRPGDESISRIERLLDGYASVIDTHIQHLQDFTSAVQGFNETMRAQNSLVSNLGRSLNYPEEKEKENFAREETVPGPKAPAFPPGCIRNRHYSPRKQLLEV